ncbi:hemin-degrading factor [Niastella caeni]|uniref:Hemin-degrading factor n=1 Tax=Niastella caeni TaxID=2569763 RepID=A0A4S8HPB1_9BACT|nr:ChuX/HutX family heme-like substrate-binding protein [Niastella caeni]THU37240.1 hemin-degrading factor [Niastella caeni]
MSTIAGLSLKDKWVAFHRENPRIRIRDAARQLGTTEAEIIAAFAGSSVIRLENKFPELWKRMPELGYIMALTRNESCVHERKGVFDKVGINSRHVGVVVGEDIDMRMFFERWAFAFAVFENEEAAFKKSIQVFDHQGTAVVKIFLQENSNHDAFGKLVREFEDTLQLASLAIREADPAPVYNNDLVDVAAFRQDWSALKDTHDFFPMLKKHNVSRLHALHIAGDYARKVANDQIKLLLQKAADAEIEIMVFVSNHGNIQIHTGPVKKIVEIPGCINVMDPSFNLHLKLDDIASTWAVKKPTSDGTIHSIEIFDAKGNLVVQFFGKRKPGAPELSAWTELVTGLQ